MTQTTTAALLLAGLQIAALRATQYLFPALYWTTAGLFTRRQEVKAGGIALRFAIPFCAGLVTPLLVSQHEARVAIVSGVVAWFLVLWPIAWSPRMLLPEDHRGPVVALLLLFWGAFGALALAGEATMALLLDLTRDRAIDWQEELVVALVTSLPITAATGIAASVAAKRVSFADDPLPDATDESEVGYEYRPSVRKRLGEMVVPISLLLSVATFLLTLIAAKRSARKQS